MTRKISVILLFATVILSACTASLGPAQPTVTSASPPAAAINAAAERAATIERDSEAIPGETSANPLPAQTEGQDDPTPNGQAPTGGSSDNQDPADRTTEPAPSADQPPDSQPLENRPATNRRVEVGEIGRFPQLIPFDGIRPVYEPAFVTAEEAPLDDDELIIGIALDGEAKAYSISVLRFREMVNDELAGIPTLVTW